MKLSEPIVFIRLAYGLPGQTRQVASDAAANDLEADRNRVRTTARLYNGKAFQAIKTADGKSKADLLSLAIPVDLDLPGTYIMPRRLLQQAESLLADAKAAREILIDTFLDESYYLERESARHELGRAFREGDYPEPYQLREAFKMEWRYFAMDVPEDLPQEIRDRESTRLQAQIDQVAADCRQALREGLAALVDHLVERLKPDTDGRKKRLSTSTVDQLKDFLSTVEARDITSDDAIRQLAAQARSVIGTVSADDIRDSAWTANKIRTGLEAVGQQISALVKTDGIRKINLDDEDAA